MKRSKGTTESDPPYQVIFLSGILLGAAVRPLEDLGWTIAKAEHTGFEVTTPSKMRLRVTVEEME